MNTSLDKRRLKKQARFSRCKNFKFVRIRTDIMETIENMANNDMMTASAKINQIVASALNISLDFNK
jgi:predicted Fe-Mo cluster-binding NifX family protein